MTTARWTEDVEVRRHNGECAYGPWMDIDDEDVPAWVEGMVADRMIEEGEDEGLVMRGGSAWCWRKGDE